MAKRKLTTVFCADIVGYAAAMARDEEATIARLKSCRALMSSHFERYQGREINTWGDAIIAEFESVVEAVRCAVDIQEAFATDNIGRDEDDQTLVRIGINLGDVVHENGNVYGDGVNIAARLESLAEPGGVLVSQTVHTMVHRQLALGFDPLPPQQVKRGDEPVTGYRVRIGGSNHPAEEDWETEEDDLPFEPPPPMTGEAVNNPDPGLQLKNFLQHSFTWVFNQPKRVRFSLAMIAFFFSINLLFSGLANPWFIFP